MTLQRKENIVDREKKCVSESRKEKLVLHFVSIFSLNRGSLAKYGKQGWESQRFYVDLRHTSDILTTNEKETVQGDGLMLLLTD